MCGHVTSREMVILGGEALRQSPRPSPGPWRRGAGTRVQRAASALPRVLDFDKATPISLMGWTPFLNIYSVLYGTGGIWINHHKAELRRVQQATGRAGWESVSRVPSGTRSRAATRSVTRESSNLSKNNPVRIPVSHLGTGDTGWSLSGGGRPEQCEDWAVSLAPPTQWREHLQSWRPQVSPDITSVPREQNGPRWHPLGQRIPLTPGDCVPQPSDCRGPTRLCS